MDHSRRFSAGHQLAGYFALLGRIPRNPEFAPAQGRKSGRIPHRWEFFPTSPH